MAWFWSLNFSYVKPFALKHKRNSTHPALNPLWHSLTSEISGVCFEGTTQHNNDSNGTGISVTGNLEQWLSVVHLHPCVEQWRIRHANLIQAPGDNHVRTSLPPANKNNRDHSCSWLQLRPILALYTSQRASDSALISVCFVVCIHVLLTIELDRILCERVWNRNAISIFESIHNSFRNDRMETRYGAYWCLNWDDCLSLCFVGFCFCLVGTFYFIMCLEYGAQVDIVYTDLH